MFLVFSLAVSSQETIGTYVMSYFGADNAITEIKANKPKPNGDFNFYISTVSSRQSENVTLILNQKDLAKFKEIINKCMHVFSDWKAVAIENNVTELNRNISIDRLKLSAAFYYGRNWHIDNNVYLEPRFSIIDGKYLLIITSVGKLKSATNQYIDSEGFFIVFNAEDEITDFLSMLDPQKVKDHFSKEDLFKQ